MDGFLFKEFLPCKQRVFVGETSKLDSTYAKFYKAHPRREIYYGQKKILKSHYYWKISKMDEDRDGKINRRFQTLLHSGILHQIYYRTSKERIQLESYIQSLFKYFPLNMHDSISSIFILFLAGLGIGLVSFLNEICK